MDSSTYRKSNWQQAAKYNASYRGAQNTSAKQQEKILKNQWN
jgi:hypothetical protein